uniref:Uncharacterized protein n=1 Tax=viral metagenome TaxID=1070528 RepID=A0A6M3XN83_9ZZZZ
MAEGFDIRALISDPNFQSFLAGTGAGLDPQGVGGAIGVPAQQMIQSKAAQKATAAGASRQEKFMQQLIQLLGGLTPKEMPGPTSVKMGPGQMSIDLTPPSGAGGFGAAPVSPEAGGGFQPTPQERRMPQISDIIPF